MRLVVDANIFVAAFFKSSVTRELLLDPRLDLYAPEHLLVETRKVLKKRSALRKMGITTAQFDGLFDGLTTRIKIIAEDEYRRHLGEAARMAPHPEDAPYLAAALLARAHLWSNDAGMKNQDEVRVYTTREILKELSAA